MFKILLVLTFFAFVSFALNFVSLVSNEWFSVFIRENTCNTQDLSDQCLQPGFKRVLTLGYWFVCPTSLQIETTWVFDRNLKDVCFFLKSHDRRVTRINKTVNIFSTHLKNSKFLGIEVGDIDTIQALEIIGSALLLFACLVITGVLVYVVVTVDRTENTFFKELYRSNENLFDLDKNNKRVKKKFYTEKAKFKYIIPYLQLIFAFHLIELIPRLTSFIILTIKTQNYVKDIIRTSYSFSTGKNYFGSDFDTIVNKIASNYNLTMNWTFWLHMVSLTLSCMALVLIFLYFIFKNLVFWWDSKKKEKTRKRFNEFMQKENYNNRSQAFQTGLPFYNAYSLQNELSSFNWFQYQQPNGMSTPNLQPYSIEPIVKDQYFNLTSTTFKKKVPALKKLEYLDEFEKNYFENLFKKFEPFSHEIRNFKLSPKKNRLVSDQKMSDKKHSLDAVKSDIIQPYSVETKAEDTIAIQETIGEKEIDNNEKKSLFRINLHLFGDDKEKIEPVDLLEDFSISIESDSLESKDEVSNKTSLASTLGVNTDEYNIGYLNGEHDSISSDSLNFNIYTTISPETSDDFQNGNQETVQNFQKIIIREKLVSKND